MDKFRMHVKKVLNICFFVLIVVVIASMVIDGNREALPVAVVLLLVVVALVRICQGSVVEIEIKDGVAHMDMLDGKKKAIYINAIVLIRETTNGIHIRFADGEEVRTRKGKDKIVIRNGESVVNYFRKEDFPQAEFVKLK